MSLYLEISSNIHVHGSLYILGVDCLRKKCPFWRFMLMEHLNLVLLQLVRWALDSDRLIQDT